MNLDGDDVIVLIGTTLLAEKMGVEYMTAEADGLLKEMSAVLSVAIEEEVEDIDVVEKVTATLKQNGGLGAVLCQ